MGGLEGIDHPVILFWGPEDRVVPPQQAEVMAAGLRSRRIPVARLTFPGEGHGFRKAENIARTLEAELSFYGQVFGFTPAGEVEPVVVQGLSGRTAAGEVALRPACGRSTTVDHRSG